MAHKIRHFIRHTLCQHMILKLDVVRIRFPCSLLAQSSHLKPALSALALQLLFDLNLSSRQARVFPRTRREAVRDRI